MLWSNTKLSVQSVSKLFEEGDEEQRTNQEGFDY